MHYKTLPDGKILLNVKVIPGASKTEIASPEGIELRVRVAAAPEDGKANAALCAFFAKILGISKNSVNVSSGKKSRRKILSLPQNALEKLKAMPF